MKKILFVDDEINVLDGLRRLLYKMKDQWEIDYVDNAKTALEILRIKQIDIIVSDLRMPEMSGLQLLNEVKNNYPQIIRFVLSGQPDQEMLSNSLEVAHQYLSKPCEGEALINAIQNAIDLRAMLNQESLVVLLSKISSIPSLPKLYNMLVEELMTPQPSIDNVCDIITIDIGMSAKILQVVNSAFFGVRKKIYNIKEAIIYLGLDIIKSLVLGIELFSKFDEAINPKFSIKKLMDHSMICANYAEIIAKIEKSDKLEVSKSFTAGLLHDIGILLIVSNFPEKYTEIINLQKEKKIQFWEAEDICLGTNHAIVGAYLMKLWGLPDDIVNSIAYHHYPQNSNMQKTGSLLYVFAANLIYYEKYHDEDRTYNSIHETNVKEALKLHDKISIWKEACFNYN